MKRLWLADIHANQPAFEAVLAAAGPVDETVFLGDAVGYGPHPEACLRLLGEIGPRAVAGNHDAGVLARNRWCDFVRRRLPAAPAALLAGWPPLLRLPALNGTATIVHHPPGAPYLHPALSESVFAECLRAVPGEIVIAGHSHYPLDRVIGGRRFVCIPAVGQPRNGDPRAGYALERDGNLEFRFVAYDVERVVRDVRRLGLEAAFCERWCRFIRTGYDAGWSRGG